MKIGLDLDHVVLSHPEFFGTLIETFSALGHEFYCTSGRGRDVWESRCIPDLVAVGIDHTKINPCLMTPTETPHVTDKARMADHLDMVFDDDAGRIQPHTKTPIFYVPVKNVRWSYFCAKIL